MIKIDLHKNERSLVCFDDDLDDLFFLEAPAKNGLCGDLGRAFSMSFENIGSQPSISSGYAVDNRFEEFELRARNFDNRFVCRNQFSIAHGMRCGKAVVVG